MTSIGDMEWQIIEDKQSGRRLYFSEKSGVTTFDKPDVLKTVSELKRVCLLSAAACYA